MPTPVPPSKPRTPIWIFLQSLAAILMRVFFDLQVRGLHHMPRSGGVLVVSNHQSFLDPVVLAVLHRRPFAFLADAYLFKFKPFGWLIRSLNAFPIQTGKGDVGAIKQTIALLQAGEVLTIYPEGTRSPNGQLQPVLGGAALAIRRAKVPVMPAIIVGAYEAYPRQAKIPRPGRVRVVFDQPVQLDHLKGEEIVTFLQQKFATMFAEANAWRNEGSEREGD
jgi:1-acyl-sn-glycerol-3-phosphate acyltransferase